MKINLYNALLLSFLLASCSSSAPAPAGLEDDKILIEYKKELNVLAGDIARLKDEQELIDHNIQKMSVSPKIMRIIKKQRHVNAGYIAQVQQAVNYIKVRSKIREKYILDSHNQVTVDDLNKEFEEYKIGLKTNPPQYPWRVNTLEFNTSLLERKVEKKKKKKK